MSTQKCDYILKTIKYLYNTTFYIIFYSCTSLGWVFLNIFLQTVILKNLETN